MNPNLSKPALLPPLLVLCVSGIATGCKVGQPDNPPVSVIEASSQSRASSSSSTSSSVSSDSSSSVANTDFPAQLAFEHAGFEFCCGGYDTYGAHGFAASGVVKKLDGGQWAADISGAQGERVFASYGDGFDGADDTTAEWQGWDKTGTATTTSFAIQAPYVNLLVGGGTNIYTDENATAIVLRVDGEVVRHATGNGQEAALSPVTWDLSDYVGQSAVVEIIDNHADDGTDESLPFVLVDQIEMSSTPETTPSGADVDGDVPLVLTQTPETEGVALFSGEDADQNLAGFEFCCGNFNTYQEHGFGSTGDFVKLNGGQWGADIQGAVGERAFASYGEAFADESSPSEFLQWSAIGRVSTPEFTVSSRYINFLVGGGQTPYDQPHATAVVLKVGGEVVRQASGGGEDNVLAWHTWDVSAFKGQSAVVEFIDLHDDDGSDERLPYIIADQFRAADKAAVEPMSESRVRDTVTAPSVERLKMGDPNPYYEDGTYHVFYLHDDDRHPWYLSSTEDLLNFSSPQEVLPTGSDPQSRDYWTGSGSIVKDEQGGYRLFYTGHNQAISPVEAVMQARSTGGDLTEWDKQENSTFSASDGYSDYDFRDPKVFYNETQGEYWMLLTSRYQDDAAIALYRSEDLQNWQAQSPLYTESSSLNLEVPDFVTLDGSDYLLFSDQRQDSRQVRHLVRDMAGSGWRYPTDDALDGKDFYAGRAAGPEGAQMLFGWVAHTHGLTDAGQSRWGGDLVVHQLSNNAEGQLVVGLPDQFRSALSTTVEKDVDWTEGSVTQAGEGMTIDTEGAFTLANASGLRRFEISLSELPSQASYGLHIRDGDNGEVARVTFNPDQNQASFHFANGELNPQAPSVSVPLDQWSSMTLDVLLHPERDYGVVYINHYRALTFRYYGLGDNSLGVFSDAGIAVQSIQQLTQ